MPINIDNNNTSPTNVNYPTSPPPAESAVPVPVPAQEPPVPVPLTTHPITPPQGYFTSPAEQPTIKKKRVSLPVIAGIIVLFLLTSLITSSVMIAYDVIPFPNEKMKTAIEDFVMRIPFTPKTPPFLLRASVNAHKKVSSGELDASMAVEIDAGSAAGVITALSGLTSQDFSVKGTFDFSDTAAPEGQFDIRLTRDFDSTIILKDKKAFFKINKFPLMITMLSGLESSLITDKWVYTDISKMETGARTELETFKESQGEENALAEFYDDFLRKVMREKVLKKTKVTQEKSDGRPSYKLHFEADGKLINELYTEIEGELDKRNENENESGRPVYPRLRPDFRSTTDYIDTLIVDLWLDKNKYYLNKINIILSGRIPGKMGAESVLGAQSNLLTLVPMDYEYKNNDSVTGPGLGTDEEIKYKVVWSVQLSKIGEKFSIQAPEGAVSVEEFVKQISQSSGSGLHPNYQLKKARSAKINVDFTSTRNSIRFYYLQNKTVPASLDELVPNDIKSLPESVTYKKVLSGDGYFLFATDTIYDSPNPLKPYMGAYVKASDMMGSSDYPKTEHFSKDEIIGIVGEVELQDNNSRETEIPAVPEITPKSEPETPSEIPTETPGTLPPETEKPSGNSGDSPFGGMLD